VRFEYEFKPAWAPWDLIVPYETAAFKAEERPFAKSPTTSIPTSVQLNDVISLFTPHVLIIHAHPEGTSFTAV
jgi:hypothetical protein